MPDPVRLYKLTFDAPTLAYEGHMMITQWRGSEIKAEEALVYYKPPNNYRMEFLLPDGSIDRVVLFDGKREKIQLMSKGVVVKEYTSKKTPALLNEEQKEQLIGRAHV